MKIDRISVWQLDLPLHKPYWLSGGRLKFEQLDSTIVRIDTDAGVSGWGEGCPWGVTYLPAFGKGIRAGIDELALLLLGKDPRQFDTIKRVGGSAPARKWSRSTRRQSKGYAMPIVVSPHPTCRGLGSNRLKPYSTNRLRSTAS
jgi:L-alanine-DL-glutamate epimerase-like enolase superfamily enzyme